MEDQETVLRETLLTFDNDKEQKLGDEHFLDKTRASFQRFRDDYLQNVQKITTYNTQIDGLLDNLDQKLQLVVKKQQEEYFKSYQYWIEKKETEFARVLKQLQVKIQERDKKDEKISELHHRLSFEQSKRVDLEVKLDKFYKERRLFKQLISKLRDDVASYRQSSFDDVRRAKHFERLSEGLEGQLARMKEDLETQSHQARLNLLSEQNVSLQHSSTENLLGLEGKEGAATTNEGNMVRFRAFLDNLFKGGIKESEIKKEIISYFQAIDLGYREKVMTLQRQLKERSNSRLKIQIKKPNPPPQLVSPLNQDKSMVELANQLEQIFEEGSKEGKRTMKEKKQKSINLNSRNIDTDGNSYFNIRNVADGSGTDRNNNNQTELFQYKDRVKTLKQIRTQKPSQLPSGDKSFDNNTGEKKLPHIDMSKIKLRNPLILDPLMSVRNKSSHKSNGLKVVGKNVNFTSNVEGGESFQP